MFLGIALGSSVIADIRYNCHVLKISAVSGAFGRRLPRAVSLLVSFDNYCMGVR